MHRNIDTTNMTPEVEGGSAALTMVRRAILVVDLVESVRLMQAYEADVIDRWRRFVAEVRQAVLPRHEGRLVKHLGDAMLMEFETVDHALAAAFDIQQRIGAYNVARAPEAAMHLRQGLHVCDVLVDDLDVFGAGVNLSARLASLAQPGAIVVSPDVKEDLVPGLDAEFEDMGECWVKHLPTPVRAYRARRPASAPEAGERAAPAPAAGTLLPRLAVLDFDVPSGAAALGSLVADELAGLFSVNGSVEVVSRLSTRARLRPDRAPLALLRHVNAAYGVSGSCRQTGGAITLHVELLSVATDTVVWSDEYRGRQRDLLAAPGDALQAMVSAAIAALSAHETRRARMLPIASLESYALLVGGVTLMHRLSLADFERGRELLEAVSERVPRHPDAHAWLAKWHILRAHQGWSADPAASASRADDSAKRALDHDPECSLALTIAGMVQTYFHRRLDRGEALYRQALAANPNDALAWLLKGTLHGFRGEGAEALHDTRRALALSPIDPMHYYYDALAASAAVSAGEYVQAVTLAERSLRANSQHASTLRVLAIAHSMRGDLDAARPVVERMLAIEPTFTVRRFLERAPGADYAIGKTFAEALRRAGVPD